MSKMDEVLGRLDFQKKKLAQATVDGIHPGEMGKMLFALIDTMEQLAGVVKDHVDRGPKERAQADGFRGHQDTF